MKFEKRLKALSLEQYSYSIDILSCGLRIVCHSELLERVRNFHFLSNILSFWSFSSINYDWKNIRNRIQKPLRLLLELFKSTHVMNSNKINSLYSKNSKQHQDEKRNVFYVSINIGAPKIIIPLMSTDALIMDLGHLTMVNNIENKNSITKSLSCSISSQSQLQDSDDEAFFTPNTSPEPTDDLLEVETTFYSINVIQSDNANEYVVDSSYRFTISDINIGFLNDYSQLIEKFNMYIAVQYPINHLCPLPIISGKLSKMISHLDIQKIQTLYYSAHVFSKFFEHIDMKSYYQSNILNKVDFQFDEISVLLSYDSQDLCNISLRNIYVILINGNDSFSLNFILEKLIIFDCVQNIGDNYQVLLSACKDLKENNHFISAYINVLKNSQNHENVFTIDFKTDNLEFIFNPETMHILSQFIFSIVIFYSNETTLRNIPELRLPIRFNITGKFEEINILFICQTSTILPIQIHVQNLYLNVLLNPFSIFELNLNKINIFNLGDIPHEFSNTLAPDQEQISILLDASDNTMNHELSRNEALKLLLINTKDDIYELSIKIINLSYLHSMNFISGIEQTLNYINKYFHLYRRQADERENKILSIVNHLARLVKLPKMSRIFLTQYTLSIDLQTLVINFPMDNIIIELDRIHITNDEDQVSQYQININGLDVDLMNHIRETKSKIKKNYIYSSQNSVMHFIENISICFNFEISDSSIEIDSKLISSLRIFLNQYRTICLFEVLNKLRVVREKILLIKFIFQLCSSEIILSFLNNQNYESSTLFEIILNKLKLTYEEEHSNNKRIALQFDFLRIETNLIKFEEPLLVLRSPAFIELNSHQIGSCYQQCIIKINHIDIKLLECTFILLIQIIEVFFVEFYLWKTNSKK